MESHTGAAKFLDQPPCSQHRGVHAWSPLQPRAAEGCPAMSLLCWHGDASTFGSRESQLAAPGEGASPRTLLGENKGFKRSRER